MLFLNSRDALDLFGQFLSRPERLLRLVVKADCFGGDELLQGPPALELATSGERLDSRAFLNVSEV